ncbi:unnamed protein product [Effrenium voratum]|uniref:Class I SAM-dependent methyltransferase n=1 Tax=Effrenium voratum TaxID=2562239 RepID=A0AA36HN67_9DINO|nr:unnamed protein product [Effrenium voratum]CAJ1442514.1 unnamed protein product [Effrenium voratum]
MLAGSLQIEVREWFASLIPRRFPHRRIALTAAEHGRRLLSELQVAGSPERPTCAQRAGATRRVMAAFRAFAAWATALPRKNGTVNFGHHEGMGAAGVALIWMNQVSEELLYALDWRRELLCEGTSQLPSLGGCFMGIARMQTTWPWLVDAVAAASAGRVRAAVPAPVLFAPQPSQVLLHILGSGNLMVEVGVDKGQTSEELLEALPNLTILGVDPYLGRYNGQESRERLDGMGGEEAFRQAAQRYSRFQGRARLWRQRSAAAAAGWTGPAPDLVFIDGEHDFESCAEDLRLWAPLLTTGGVLAGHDYRAGEQGVVRAVHQNLPDGATLHLAPHGVWWWYVP